MRTRKRQEKGGIKRVAVIGSQGLPANYGGFETLVENIVAHKSEKVEYTVFCSGPDMRSSKPSHNGSRLIYLPLHAHGAQSIPYDSWALARALRSFDAVLMLGVSGGLFLPIFKLLSKAKVIVNVDGLEHLREKWSGVASSFLKLSLDICVHLADTVVADNIGVKEYLLRKYGIEATLIAYGGDHATRSVNPERTRAILDFYGLQPGGYDLSICRVEPENTCHITLESYAGMGHKLVMIGNWNHSSYSRTLKEKYGKFSGIHLIDAIYDLDILHALRANARYYVHGHKAGGTNPSLVEAMHCGRPILAYDVVYNRCTTRDTAYYYRNAGELAELATSETLSAKSSSELAAREYVWDKIAAQYEALFRD